jgi:hypothetical protein
MRVLALTKKVEPSLPLSQRMRATNRQSPFPMFLFCGIQRNVKRPSARMWRWAIGAEFCLDGLGYRRGGDGEPARTTAVRVATARMGPMLPHVSGGLGVLCTELGTKVA